MIDVLRYVCEPAIVLAASLWFTVAVLVLHFVEEFAFDAPGYLSQVLFCNVKPELHLSIMAAVLILGVAQAWCQPLTPVFISLVLLYAIYLHLWLNTPGTLTAPMLAFNAIALAINRLL